MPVSEDSRVDTPTRVEGREGADRMFDLDIVFLPA